MKKKTSKRLGRPPLPKSKQKVVVFARIPRTQYVRIAQEVKSANKHGGKYTVSSWLTQVIGEEISRLGTL